MHERFMHVANGTVVTRLLAEGDVPGMSSIWADPLHEGPVPGGLSDAELLNVRAQHLGDGVPADAENIADGLRSWRAAVDSHDAYDELVLWFEHDLFDQLNLIQLLSRIRRTVPPAKPVSMICIGSFPGRQRFKGLGELAPEDLASLFGVRRPVEDAQYATAERAWDAFCADDPRRIEEIVEAGTPALPFLEAAFARHLEEFPSTTNGLSLTERRVLELASARPFNARADIVRVHDPETAFYISIEAVEKIVRELTTAPSPLLQAERDPGDGADMPGGLVAPTAHGRDVLGGRVDRVSASGLDRWLGGVHLSGSGAMWRWDPASRRLVFQ